MERIIVTTERLVLREWTESMSDIEALKSFLQDKEVMYAYEHGFSDAEVLKWLKWNMQSYQKNGFGLWAIELKETSRIIGECGLTNQFIEGKEYLEIGYHLCKSDWGNGYAIEAAKATKEYAFLQLHYQEVVSMIRDTNISSMNVAIRNGMTIKKRFTKYYQGIEMPHYLFSTSMKSS